MALEYEEALNGLSEKEKLYMYYLYKAIAAGWRVFPRIECYQQITAIQVSEESPYIISLFLRVFREESADQLKSRLLEDSLVVF